MEHKLTAGRRPHKSIIVVAGEATASPQPPQLIVESLAALGVQTISLGWEESAQRIAAAVAEEQADTVELCITGGGVQLLRALLRELIRIGRRDTRIVVHRTDRATRAPTP